MASYVPHNRTSPEQHLARTRLVSLFRESPLPEDELLINLGLYARSSAFAKLLFLDELYRKILNVPGVALVFGVWWGQDVVAIHNLRAIHEPYNPLRRVVGFDTFMGYPTPSESDRPSETISQGAYHVSEGYIGHLNSLLEYHQEENILGGSTTFELIQGDIVETLPRYLDAHPEMIVALAYLDLALYEPTKRVLELLQPRFVRGAVIAMDELNSPNYPGETLAYREVMGLREHSITQSAILPDRTFTVVS